MTAAVVVVGLVLVVQADVLGELAEAAGVSEVALVTAPVRVQVAVLAVLVLVAVRVLGIVMVVQDAVIAVVVVVVAEAFAENRSH